MMLAHGIQYLQPDAKSNHRGWSWPIQAQHLQSRLSRESVHLSVKDARLDGVRVFHLDENAITSG
jgi:hypothetical protein